MEMAAAMVRVFGFSHYVAVTNVAKILARAAISVLVCLPCVLETSADDLRVCVLRSLAMFFGIGPSSMFVCWTRVARGHVPCSGWHYVFDVFSLVVSQQFGTMCGRAPFDFRNVFRARWSKLVMGPVHEALNRTSKDICPLCRHLSICVGSLRENHSLQDKISAPRAERIRWTMHENSSRARSSVVSVEQLRCADSTRTCT